MKSLLLSILLLPLLLKAQTENVAVTMMFVQEDHYLTYNLDVEPVGEWLKDVISVSKTHLKELKGKGQVALGLEITTQGTCTYYLATDLPELDASKKEGMLAELRKTKAAKTKAANDEVILFFDVNGASSKDYEDLKAKVGTPALKMQDKLLNGTTAERKEALKQRCLNYLLPLMMVSADKDTDEKFAGVKSTGAYYSTHIGELANTEALCKDLRIWRGMMEMSPKNYLIMSLFPIGHILNGRLDAAKMQLQIMDLTAAEKSLAGYVVNELFNHIQSIYKPLYADINKGVELHDKGKYAEAVKIFEAVLKEDPQMALAIHELALSRSMIKNASSSEQIWAEYAPRLYAASPMYPYQMHAGSGEEAYLTFLRLELAELFQKGETFGDDLYRYANIAMELGNYGYAAQYFWLHVSLSRTKKPDAIELMAYCIHKCGTANLEGFFSEKTLASFQETEKLLKKRMVESATYKAMEKKK